MANKALKTRLKAFYKDNKVQSRLNLKKLSLKWIKGKGAPRLRAKAGQASCLVPFTVELAADFSWADGDLGHYRCQSMQKLARICALAKQEALTHEELTCWRRLSSEHMFYYACSGFPAYPKYHYLQHFPQHILRGGVPRTYWVYSDEAKNKEVKGLWAAVSKGHSVCEQVLLRLLWLDALDNLD
jgi:hypothetical protein